MTTAPAHQRPQTEDSTSTTILELAAAWDTLHKAQLATIRALRQHRHLRTVTATRRVRTTLADFLQAVAVFDRTARAVAERWTMQDLPQIYRDGARTALARTLRATGIPFSRPFAWTDRHQAAITALAAQYYTDLIARIQQTVRRAQAFVRAARDQTRTPEGVQRQQLLADHGLDTVVYRDQTRHPASSWARAALGAQAVTTRNTAALTYGRHDLDALWFECIDGSECGFTQHGDLDKANGTIRSAEDAEAYPTAHFGCVRSWIPRPDLNNAPGLESGADL
ncbi:hypothetical protein ACH4TP_37720 [Streptomyces sp. NPDC021012]|uniref:hypothetical protein n=1 Tax=Streptomyces sp. NPDC021012 TaxID=3365107 RepID=UPI003790EB5B